jgi:carbamoyltransferase
MEKVYEIKNNKRPIIPAVVHEDGSGRLQTVSKETNPLFYSMINKFREITGVPLVLNTSFNLNGEPLVCSPTDTIRTFFSCGLDFLAIGNYLVQKE